MSARHTDGTAETLTLSRVDAPSDDWDPFVEQAPGATHCHLAAWHPIMDEVMKAEPVYFEARAPDGSLAGVLPMASVKSVLFGRYLVSMPYLNYGGPLGGEDARGRLAAAALEEARRRGVDLLELRSRNAGGTSPHDDLQLTRRKVSVVLELPDDAEVLWKDVLRSKVRSQVRRPRKEGLEVRFGAGEVDAFYRVFERHMRDLGTPVLPRALFRALPKAFGERVVVAVIYREEEPVAGGFGFLFRDEFEITWASSLREHSRVAPNMLLYWNMMERAIEEGCTAFNFGRCTPGGGTHRFKLQWGGEDEPLDWAAWSAGDRLATPNPEEGRWAPAIRAWRRLPVPLTRLVGPPLARRIP